MATSPQTALRRSSRLALRVGAASGVATMGYLGVALSWVESRRWTWRYARATSAAPAYPADPTHARRTRGKAAANRAARPTGR
ncbi:MAG TPA: hypothetical protein VNG13_04585 [Mycobacteriales bacterium]|nr:hypothetical protein [Mycobacteriales bacterium]